MKKLYELSISEAHELLKRKQISSVELTSSILERIASLNTTLGAYISVTEDVALDQANKADQFIARGNIQPLTGIPISIKDVICTKKIRTTCGSKILANFIPPYDATVITKLKDQGAVIVGKTNMDEFAMGSSTEHSAFYIARNPWNINKICGGSSGGSAVAVSADLCLGSLGSDTGGSIRQPASHCGIVGIKPTYGRVSRYGLIAFASSLDQIGCLTKTVTDSAILLKTISGHDPRDSTSVPQPVPDYLNFLKGDLKGITIGLPKEYHTSEGLHPDVKKSIDRSIQILKELGASVKDISLPHTRHCVAVYYIIATSEASSNLARYDGVKYGFRVPESDNLIEMYRQTRSIGFGQEVQRRIILGTYCLSAGYYDAYYKKASQVRTLLMQDFKNAFEQCDVIVSPVAPTPAFDIGEKTNDPLTMYLSDIFTLSANLAGIPGMSVPCGFSSDGLPIGLQLMSNHFKEDLLLHTAFAFEQTVNIFGKKPMITLG